MSCGVCGCGGLVGACGLIVNGVSVWVCVMCGAHFSDLLLLLVYTHL